MEEHKKLNGFNNGRDTTDGVGGNLPPFEMKRITAEDILNQDAHLELVRHPLRIKFISALNEFTKELREENERLKQELIKIHVSNMETFVQLQSAADKLYKELQVANNYLNDGDVDSNQALSEYKQLKSK